MRHYTYLFMAIVLSGCGSGRTIVKNKPSVDYVSNSVLAEEDLTKGGPEIDQRYKLYFKKYLEENLYKKNRFVKGDCLRIKYYFFDAAEGSRAERYLGGFGVGEGSVYIIVNYFDKSGTEIVSTECIGTVTGGFGGGSFDLAIENAADEIVKYATKNFLKN